MALNIVPFGEAHLEAGARLLAAQQKGNRRLEPLLPSQYEAAEEARPVLEELYRGEGAEGALAMRDGEPVAMLFALPRLPERGMGLPFHGRALATGEPVETYRDLYAYLADRWVRRGFFGHTVVVLPGDLADRDTWDSLGFGRWLTCAIRSVDEPVSEAPELDIRQLGSGDVDVIAALEAANARHHNTSPIFVPYLPEGRAQYRSQTEGLLQDAANAHFVAYEGGEPAGMNTFIAEPRHSKVVQPQHDIYLYQGVVEEPYRHAGIGRGLLARSLRWARDQGHETCTLHYFSANILGSRFWLGQGFRPYYHILYRHIDERMAWARPDIQTR